MEWDDYFINMCYAVAEKSKDRSTKVGCVVVGPGREIRSTGFNGLPRGVLDKEMTFDEYEDFLIERKVSYKTKCFCDGETNEIINSEYPLFDDLNKEINRRYDERPYKYKWVAHAEFNAVCHAARSGTSLDGCTIYVPWLPCSNCAMAIIQSGIKEVVLDGNFEDNPGLMARWKEEHDITNAMFQEAGIIVRKTKDKTNPKCE